MILFKKTKHKNPPDKNIFLHFHLPSLLWAGRFQIPACTAQAHRADATPWLWAGPPLQKIEQGLLGCEEKALSLCDGTVSPPLLAVITGKSTHSLNWWHTSHCVTGELEVRVMPEGPWWEMPQLTALVQDSANSHLRVTAYPITTWWLCVAPPTSVGSSFVICEMGVMLGIPSTWERLSEWAR